MDSMSESPAQLQAVSRGSSIVWAAMHGSPFTQTLHTLWSIGDLTRRGRKWPKACSDLWRTLQRNWAVYQLAQIVFVPLPTHPRPIHDVAASKTSTSIQNLDRIGKDPLAAFYDQLIPALWGVVELAMRYSNAASAGAEGWIIQRMALLCDQCVGQRRHAAVKPLPVSRIICCQVLVQRHNSVFRNFWRGAPWTSQMTRQQCSTLFKDLVRTECGPNCSMTISAPLK